MKICVYSSTDAPPAQRCIARLQVEGGFLPIHFSGSTEDGARQKAQTYWDVEAEKQAAQKLGTARVLQDRLGKLDPVAEAPDDDDLLGDLLG